MWNSMWIYFHCLKQIDINWNVILLMENKMLNTKYKPFHDPKLLIFLISYSVCSWQARSLSCVDKAKSLY